MYSTRTTIANYGPCIENTVKNYWGMAKGYVLGEVTTTLFG